LPEEALDRILGGLGRRPASGPALASAQRARASYRAAGRAALGGIAFAVDGGAPGTLFEAVLDPSRRFDRTELLLTAGSPSGPAWEFLRPFTRLTLGGEGSAELQPVQGPAERSIARILPREGFAALPSSAEFGPGRLPTFAQFARALREGGYVPFEIALELYAPHERLRYELDLVDGRLLVDPRAGRWPVASRPRRPSRAAWNFDQAVSSANLPPRSARILEAIWEAGVVSEVDLAQVFGGPDGYEEAIGRLSRMRLVEADPRGGGWRARFDTLGRAPRSASVSTAARPSESVLRRSMSELLAGAEARATCPVCGGDLPPGYHQLLCDRCRRDVAGADSTG
jgi:hypothetical protein